MSTTIKLFFASAIFSAVIAAAYGAVTREPIGTTLLAFMAVAPAFVGAWLVLGARAYELPGDRPDETHEEATGDSLGRFPEHSGWPIVLAAGAMVAAAGLVFGQWLLYPGLVIAGFAMVRLLREF